MIRWIPYAFVRIVAFFMLGILLGIYYPETLHNDSASILFLALVSAYGLLFYLLWNQKPPLRLATDLKFYAGAIGSMAILVAGFLNAQSHVESKQPDHLAYIEQPIEFYEVVVTSASQQKSNSWKMEASIQSIRTNDNWKPCKGKMLLYVSKKSQTGPLEYGDVLLVKGQPERIPGPSNPEEFDYQRFLSFKNIYHQHFINAHEFKRISFQPPSWVNYYALKCRKWADASLRKHVKGEREKALASALVLGVTEGLDDELLSAYKATGAMHVLAVSGLHVGIIYGLLLFVLRPLQKGKTGTWLVAGICLVLLWMYGFVTGLSPSVLRAVTMFSFLALAKPAGHRTNIYNTLAASAFCILLYDPFFIMSVGFQLSYLAVLGIVYLQQGLYNLWEPASRILDEVWKVTCVSIAAQVATFALGLLYFHQFPNYFLLSNLVVIPGSFVILILGLVILAVNFISPVATALGFALEWIIKILNYVVFALEDLPFSLIENVYITNFQCWLLIGIVVMIIQLVRTKSFKMFAVTCLLCGILSGSRWIYYYNDVDIEKFTVYNVKGHAAMDFTDRGQTYFIADSSFRQDVSKIAFHITPHRVRLGAANIIRDVSNFQFKRDGCSLFVWKGKTVLQISHRSYDMPTGLSIDYVVISNNAVTDVQQLYSQLRIGYLIIDSSNTFRHADKLLTQSQALGVESYSVLHQGAFEHKI